MGRIKTLPTDKPLNSLTLKTTAARPNKLTHKIRLIWVIWSFVVMSLVSHLALTFSFIWLCCLYFEGPRLCQRFSYPPPSENTSENRTRTQSFIHLRIFVITLPLMLFAGCSLFIRLPEMLKLPIFWVPRATSVPHSGIPIPIPIPTRLQLHLRDLWGAEGLSFQAGRGERVSYYFSLINRLSAACRWLSLPPYVIPSAAPSDSDTCHWKNVNMKCIYVEMWKNFCAKYKYPPVISRGMQSCCG